MPRPFTPPAVLAIACLLSTAMVRAEEPAAPAEGALREAPVLLSLDRALQWARERAPDVRLSQAKVREAQASRVGAGIVMPANPRLLLEARPSIPQSAYSHQRFGYAANVDFLFEVGGAPGARVREADHRAANAQAEADVARFYAALQAWKMYVAASIAQQRIEDTREALLVARRVADAARERIAAGASGDIDAETARLEVAQIEAALQGAQRELEQHLMGLRDVLDLPGAQPVTLTTRLGAPAPSPALELLVQHALRKRPELAAIRTRIGLLQATDERLEREVSPRVGLFTGVDAAPYSAMFWSVGASVELPVAQRNQGPRAVAAREIETERGRFELEQRRIAREVAAARAAYESRRAELAMLADQAIPAAERNLALIEIGWRSGRFDVFRVTAASRDLVRSKALRLDALEAAWLERIALEQAAGGWPL
jgi:outer membrane protein TolC